MHDLLENCVRLIAIILAFTIGKIVGKRTVMLIKNGKILEDNLRKYKLSMRELMKYVKIHEILHNDTISADLDNNGNIRIFSQYGEYSNHHRRGHRMQT